MVALGIYGTSGCRSTTVVFNEYVNICSTNEEIFLLLVSADRVMAL